MKNAVQKTLKLFCSVALTAALIAGLGITAVPASAQGGAVHYITEDITENTTWDSGDTYIIAVTGLGQAPKVAEGVTLTIQPGVTVLLGDGSSDEKVDAPDVGLRQTSQYLMVEGTLQAPGTADAPILFSFYNRADSTEDSVDNRWGAVIFQSGSAGIFDYCSFEYGGDGSSIYGIVHANFPEAISFSHCTFKNGVTKDSGTTAAGGIYFKGSSESSLEIENTEFRDLGQSVQVPSDSAGDASVSISGCMVVNCALGSGDWAAMSIRGGNASVTGCTFSLNGKTDLDLNGASSAVVTGNAFANISGYEKYPLVFSSETDINRNVAGHGNTFANYPETCLAGPVYGNIPADCDACWGDTGLPYLITSRIYVEASADSIGSLTIAPGQRVIFRTADSASPAVLNLLGSITAEGTQEKPIRFTSWDSGADGYINAVRANTYYGQPFRGKFSFDYCIFDGLKKGVFIQNAFSSEINVSEIGLTVRNSSFKSLEGNGIEITGTAYSAENTSIENCTFLNNAGHSLFFKGINADYKFQGIVIKNSALRNNAAAAIYLSNAQNVLIDSCEFRENAGAVYLYQSALTINKSLVADGSAMALVGSSGTTYGAVDASGSTVIMENCTLARNAGYGLYAHYTGGSVKNTIIWENNTYDMYRDGTGAFPVSYSCMGEQAGATLSNCISANPLFNDAPAGDFTLKSNSPCRNTGENGVDMGYIPGNGGTGDVTAPSVPENLRSAATTVDSISLCWDASTDVSGIEEYILEMKSGSQEFDDVGSREIGTVSDTVYTASGLKAETAYTFRVRAKDTAGNVSSWSNEFTASTLAAPQTDSVVVTFLDGSTTYATKTILIGTSLGGNFPADPSKSNYTFGGWFTGTNGTGTQYTSSTTVNADISLYAKWTYNSGGGGGGSTPATPTYKATFSGANISETTPSVSVNASAGSAIIELGNLAVDIFSGAGTAVLTVPSIPGVNSYTLGIPAASLSGLQGEGALTFSTGAGSATIQSGMLAGMAGTEGKNAGITIAQIDKSVLPKEVQSAIGDRPLIQLTLTMDDAPTEWNNPDAPVTVSIPYTPTASELANPESIVVCYIDGSGKVVSVPSGRYDAATGTVTFITTHFSYYAVSYKQVSFRDMAEDTWYAKAVSFIAAREITNGTGGGNYSPDAHLTRGDFLVMLMKAYGIAPDTNLADNFSDAGNTWYTGYLAAAKRLGISAGVGGNMYAPGKEITRQEMFTLLYNALKTIGQLPQGDSGKTLSDFSDSNSVADWARDAMTLLVKTGTVGGSGGKLNPTGTTTRAEMAQVLYNLLGR